MRAVLIRHYKSLHTWTGIVAGLGLFIAFYGGALTVFKEPLTRWASPPAAQQTEGLQTLFDLETAPALIRRTLEAHPEVGEDFVLHLAPGIHRPSPLAWKRHAGAADEHDDLTPKHYFALPAADGYVEAKEGTVSKVGEFIDVLHRVVGLPFDNNLNRIPMGIIAMLYALALLSGLVIVLPSLARDFLALRLGKNLKRMWMDVHNVVGVASLPFHLLIAVTALGFAFHDGVYFLQERLIHGGEMRAAFAPRLPAADASTDLAPLIPPAKLVAQAKALSPTFEPERLHFVRLGSPRAMVRIWGHDPTAHSPRAPGGFLALNPHTGDVLTADYVPGRQSRTMSLVASLFALHFGAFGGAPIKWIYLFLGFAGAWLVYSGNVLWVESRRRKSSRGTGVEGPAQRRDVRMLAALTVGVCLGCVCGVSFSLGLSKWIFGWVDDLLFWHQAGYYAVFFGAIAWAFGRGAARASIDLLWAAAVLTLSLPITSLLGRAFPTTGFWGHASTVGVDVAAIMLAACFAWMAVATRRRALTGPKDSVWSLAPQVLLECPPDAAFEPAGASAEVSS